MPTFSTTLPGLLHAHSSAGAHSAAPGSSQLSHPSSLEGVRPDQASPLQGAVPDRADGIGALRRAIGNLEQLGDLTFTGGSRDLAVAVENSQRLLETSRLLQDAGDAVERAAPGSADLGAILGRHALTAANLAGQLPGFAVRPELGDASGASQFIGQALDHSRTALEVLSTLDRGGNPYPGYL